MNPPQSQLPLDPPLKSSESSEKPARSQPSISAGAQVYVVDALSLIYQVFHGMPEMTGPGGQPVAAIHGFTRDLLQLTRRHQVDYLICAFDARGPTFRHETFTAYKADRPEMPDDLQQQITGIHKMLDALGILRVELVGFEADDILATFAHESTLRGADCVLVTNDKDSRQLVSDQVKIYLIRKQKFLDRQAVIDDWGITPEQVIDFQALWGDASDNIPGVEGIGKKTAATLLQDFQTIEGIYENLDKIRGPKRQQSLRNGRPQLDVSRDLVRLRTDVPIEIDFEAARVGPLDRSAVKSLCGEFGFRRLTNELLGDETEQATPLKSDYQVIRDLSQLAALVTKLSKFSRLSVDTETTSVNPRLAELVGMSFAWAPGEACYIPFRSPLGEPALKWEDARPLLASILENEQIAKAGQNIKYDMIVLRSHGINLAGTAFDSMIADYLLDPGQRNHGLDDLAFRHLNHQTIKIVDLIGKGKSQKPIDMVPLDQVGPYASEDADIPLRLWDHLQPRLEDESLLQLFNELELPLIQVLAEMEFNGVFVDTSRLAELSEQFGERIDALEQEVYALAGEPFNISSPAQLRVILFEKLGLPTIKRTKTGPSTDVEVLTMLAREHPLPEKIIAYRQFSKLQNTYVDALARLVHPTTHRVHTSFRQDVAATGRLSSTDPNLQNIPVRTEEGRAIRSAFCAESADHVLLTADYSQIELRVLAELSQDPAMRDAFQTDQDIHRQVAAEVFEIDPDDVNSEQRHRAKAINFGIIYGQSAFGLAKSLQIETWHAAEFIDAYFERFPGVLDFMENTLDFCQKEGYVATAFGRKRRVEGVRSRANRTESNQRNLPERIGINTVIQGTAADLIKLAMIRVHRSMQATKSEARMLLQIHDELIFELPQTDQHELTTLVVEQMTNVVQWSTPLKVDVKVGRNWADCNPL